LYQQNEVLQLAMKVVRKSTLSEELRARAKVGLLALYDELDAMHSSTPDNEDENDYNCPDIDEFDPAQEPEIDPEVNEPQLSSDEEETTTKDNEEPKSQSNHIPDTVILPPPMSKTKGSRNVKPAGYKSKPPGALKKQKVDLQLESKGKQGKKDRRTCSICNQRLGHNMRSCPSDPDGQKLKLALLQKRKAKGTKRKMCSGCKKYGTGHNALTCPVLERKRIKARAKFKLKMAKKIGNKRKGKKQIKIESEEEETEEEEADEDEEEEDAEEGR
jgi:hypothetical protein